MPLKLLLLIQTKSLSADRKFLRIPNSWNSHSYHVSNRLVLPAPQVTEADLEEIVKMGVSGETARSMIETGNETPASGFIGQFKPVHAPTASRTPRVLSESGGDALKAMARNLRAISEASNPMLGGDIEIEGAIDFGVGATPKALVAATPKTLGVGITGSTPRQAIGSTPRDGISGPVIGKTPARDMMGINTPLVSSSFEETPQRQPSRFQQHLSSLFAALPKPKNDFEIVVPEGEDEEEDASLATGGSKVEDSEIIAARLEAQRLADLEKELKLRSQVIQQSLPRPSLALETLSALYGKEEEDESIEDLIQREKTVLLYNDAINYPHEDQEPLPDNLYAMDALDAYLEQAAELIRLELDSLDLPKEPELSFPVYGVDFDFDVTSGEAVELNKMTKTQYKAQHKLLFEAMKANALVSQKQEKRLQVILGGYMMRRKALEKTFKDTVKQVESLRNDYSVFSNLAAKEREFVQVRLADESRELQRVSLIEEDLQDTFRDLSFERSQLNR